MAFSVTVALLTLAPSVDAWGPDGHTIVGHIAQNLIDPDVNKTLQDLLGAYDLSNATDWCDSYDHTPAGAWSSSLHFIDYPGHQCTFSWANCPNDWCNAGALANYTKQVADTSLSFQRRQFALRFIVHMMGDIHQPLHVGSHDDQGGNLIHIGGNRFSLDPRSWLNTSNETLHAQWDTNLVKQVIFDYDTALQATSKAKWVPNYGHWWVVSNMVLQNFKGNWSSKLKEWQQPLASTSDEVAYRAGLVTVAQEAAAYGCQYAYANLDGTRVTNGTVLSREYYERAKPIVVEQLAKGGARLAQVLNDALKSAPAVVHV